jgi:hypothetical protein
MPSNTDYMVLWSPAGLSAYPAGYVSGLQTFFTDLARDSGGHQNVDSVSAQYNDLTGTGQSGITPASPSSRSTRRQDGQ